MKKKRVAGTSLSVCNSACFLLFSVSGIGNIRFPKHLGNLKMFGFSAFRLAPPVLQAQGVGHASACISWMRIDK